MAIPLKDCKQCSHYRGGYCYGFGTAKQVVSTAVAIMCETYTPLGQVQIGPLGSLAGQLLEYQIPSGIISTLKLADLAVTSAKLANASVTLLKIANAVITNAKIDPAAAIAESKLNLEFGTSALNSLISTNIDDITVNEVAIAANAAAIILNDIDIAANVAAIALRELLSNKDAVNGYLGLDASAKVPLSKLNPLLNAQIAAAAAILESKLNLNYPTHDNATDHAEAHTLASHSSKAHNELTDVTTSQHHVKTVKTTTLAELTDHNKANHDALGLDHANLSNVLTSQHHVKTSTLAELTDHNKANHDALGLSHDSLSDVSPDDHHIKTPDIDYWQMSLCAHNGIISGTTGACGVILDPTEWASFALVIPRTGTIKIVMQTVTASASTSSLDVTTTYNLGTPKYDYNLKWDGTNTAYINQSTAFNYFFFDRHISIGVTKGQLLSVRVQNTDPVDFMILTGVHIVYS